MLSGRGGEVNYLVDDPLPLIMYYSPLARGYARETVRSAATHNHPRGEDENGARGCFSGVNRKKLSES